MRRTLFVFPPNLLPAAVSSASARVARQEHGRLVKDLERSQITADGARWLATAREAVLRRLDGGAELSAKELRGGLVELAGQVSSYEHKPYGQWSTWRRRCWRGCRRPVMWCAAATPDTGGSPARLRTRMDDWLGAPVTRGQAWEGYAQLVAAYLRTFGPVTERGPGVVVRRHQRRDAAGLVGPEGRAWARPAIG
jgi:hypothetical protein